ncbi:hypothetical protein BH10PSE6_BH10PSE6_37570 [soil metagenome]
MTTITPSAPAGRARLLLAWLAVAVPLAWGVGATLEEAAALQLSHNLGLTLLPLLLGVGVCFFFFHLDRSRFTIRGVVGPYFSSVAILFALFASLLAAELWQRQNKEDILLRLEINGLKSMLHIAASVDPDTSVVRDSVSSYLRQTAYGAELPPTPTNAEQPPSEALKLLYRLASDPATFKGNAVASAAFLHALDVVRSSREDRTELHKARVAPSKFFTLLLFGLLTQIAIAFCHAGNPRALGASVMLFSVAFSAAIGILALLDDPYEGVPMVSATLPNSF